MTSILQSLIVTVAGSALVINGTLFNVNDILNNAKTVVNQANVHQFDTVLELYYSDHNSYPEVSGGEALVDTLQSDGYIENRPLNPTVFDYQPKDNGQNYSLTLAQSQ